EPAALHLLAAGGELLPKPVHFRLGLAAHDKRDGLGEFELRATVERHEVLSLELEFNGHDRAGRPARYLFALFVIAGNFPDPGIFENGGVEPYRLLGLVIEPQKWGNFLHNLFHSAFLTL